MEFSGITPTADRLQKVARKIADIVRDSGIEVFRQAVRQVAYQRLMTNDERKRREQERHEALKEKGVLYGDDDSIPDRPEGDWFFHQDMLGGYVNLPSKLKLPPKQPERPELPACLRDRKPRKAWDEADKKAVEKFHAEDAKYSKRVQAFWPEWNRAILPLFEHVKQRGFPNEDKGAYRYDFDVCCWVPGMLSPTKDPRNEILLPIPRRELTNDEKIAVLAAVYDAHWRGSEKVAPWGLSEDGSDPNTWPADAEQDEKRAAFEYFLLFEKARQLDDSDLTVVESWLQELPLLIKKAEPRYLDITLGDREASRIVNGKTLTTKFGRKEKPWKLFRELFHAGETGFARDEIMSRLWSKTIVLDNTLDKHKATANDLLETIGVEIKPDNHGVWRLAEFNS